MYKVVPKSQYIFDKSPVTFSFFTMDGKYPDNYIFENYFEFQISQGNYWFNPELPFHKPVLCETEYPENNHRSDVFIIIFIIIKLKMMIYIKN